MEEGLGFVLSGVFYSFFELVGIGLAAYSIALVCILIRNQPTASGDEERNEQFPAAIEAEIRRARINKERTLRTEAVRTRLVLESRLKFLARDEVEPFFDEHKKAHAAYVVFKNVSDKESLLLLDPYLLALDKVTKGRVLPPDPYGDDGPYAPRKPFTVPVR